VRNWLIKARKDRLLTQLDVASRVDISRAYYAQLELRQRNPSIRVARNIARLLGFNWVLFYEEENGSGPVDAKSALAKEDDRLTPAKAWSTRACSGITAASSGTNKEET
jgi:putative transcriptional regulator